MTVLTNQQQEKLDWYYAYKVRAVEAAAVYLQNQRYIYPGRMRLEGNAFVMAKATIAPTTKFPGLARVFLKLMKLCRADQAI